MKKFRKQAAEYMDASAAHPSQPLVKKRKRISKDTTARQF
jgi:hypothetical protein